MKFLKITALVIAVVLIALVLFVILNSRDLPPVDDADLQLAPEEILATEDNAYYMLLEVREQPNSTSDEKTDAFIAAAKLPGYQCPTTVNNYSFWAEPCLINHVRDYAILTAARATTSLARGDAADAAAGVMAIVQLADMLAESNGPLIEALVAMAMYDIAFAVLEDVGAELPPVQQAQIASVLQAHGPDKASIHNALRYEYLSHKDVISRIGNGESLSNYAAVNSRVAPNSYLWHPNRTLHEIADWYRLMVGLQSLPEEEVMKKLKKYTRPSPFTIMQPNGIGQIYVAVTLGSFNDGEKRMDELVERNEALITQLETN